MKKILLYISFLLVSLTLFSQNEKEQKVVVDTGKIVTKEFDKNRIQAYKKQDDFIYVVEKREPTVLEQIWNWLKRVVKKILRYLFDDIKPAVGFLKIVLKVLPYIIAILVLYFIIKFFLKVNAQNIIGGKNAEPIVTLSEEEELIKSKDLLTLITKAIHDGNYKLAIRYYYLLLLKKLSEEELIFWKQEKTNEDYKKELVTNNGLYNDFEHLTHLYDYVWYGDFLIDKEQFLQAEVSFKKVIAKI